MNNLNNNDIKNIEEIKNILDFNIEKEDENKSQIQESIDYDFDEEQNDNNNLKNKIDIEDEEPNSIILEERNVVTVVKGGKTRRKRFTCITADLKTSVGLGIAKDENSMLAFYKSKYHSFNNLIEIPITHNKSIPHLMNSKFRAANLVILPAYVGTGIIAPYFLKAFLYCCGINNIITKQFGSSNILNNSIALIKAFKILNRIIWHSTNRSKMLFFFYKKILK